MSATPESERPKALKGRRAWIRAAAAAAVVAVLISCSRRARPVGQLNVEPREIVVREGKCSSIRFDVRPAELLDRLHGNPTVFVHVLDGRRRVVGGFDHPLPHPWVPGTPQEYDLLICPSAVEPKIPPGTYRLTVGLYDDSWGYRWILTATNPDVRRREYAVATLTVAPGPE